VLEDSLAQNMADKTNRTVVAAIETTCPALISLRTKQPFMVFHSAKYDPKANIFRTYTPTQKAKINHKA
jgi:hypothetical protein